MMPAQFADIPPGVLGRTLNALVWELAVPSDYLGVKVENGWVTISGEVAHSIDVEATVSPAASVPPHLAPIVATAQAAPRQGWRRQC
jgi:hypothetical protein